jgi:Glutamine amidotransferase domain
MITQIGLFQRSGSQCRPERVEAFLKSLESFFDEPFVTAKLGSVIMGVKTSRLKEVNSNIPYCSSRLCITCDGRIDDPVMPFPLITEAIARQYELFGVNCWNRIEGDYAIACWDVQARNLNLVRDAFGTRPLNYYCTEEVVIWSSDLSYLIALIGRELEVDDYYIADYLTECQCLYRTPYENIRCVEPGTVLTITQEGLRRHEFWD